MILRRFPPMGVYETLFSFADAAGQYMGDAGTHPWAQGFPLTTQLPSGPPLPDTIEISAVDRKYPKATGEPPLLEDFARFSFGPLPLESYEQDIEILGRCLR